MALVSQKDAAKFLNVSIRTLQKWRKTRDSGEPGFIGPPYIRIGNRPKYEDKDLQAAIDWMKKNQKGRM